MVLYDLVSLITEFLFGRLYNESCPQVPWVPRADLESARREKQAMHDWYKEGEIAENEWKKFKTTYDRNWETGSEDDEEEQESESGLSAAAYVPPLETAYVPGQQLREAAPIHARSYEMPDH